MTTHRVTISRERLSLIVVEEGLRLTVGNPPPAPVKALIRWTLAGTPEAIEVSAEVEITPNPQPEEVKP